MREEEKELPINADNDNCNLGGDHNTKKEMRLLGRLTAAVPSHKNLWKGDLRVIENYMTLESQRRM